MKIKFLKIFLLFCFFYITHVKAIECEISDVNFYNIGILGKSSSDTIAANCKVSDSSSIGISSSINSTLINARGYFRVDFFNSQGKLTKSHQSQPFIGQFKNKIYSDSLAVPNDAFTARVYLLAKSERNDGNGKLSLNSLKIGDGLSIDTVLSKGYVQQANTPIDLTLKARGSSFENITLNLTIKDIDNLIIKVLRIDLQSVQEPITLALPNLDVGYYNIEAIFSSPSKIDLLRNFSIVIVNNVSVQLDKRFGIDAALSWYGTDKTEISQSLKLLRSSGIGTLRDRIKWRDIQPTENSWSPGKYLDVAKSTFDFGFDLVHVFHDAPDWTRPSLSPTKTFGDRVPPNNDSAIHDFGMHYAISFGKYAKFVEYWNEPNIDFFLGMPYQYANGLKAFYTGIKSENNNINVLIGSASDIPGEFFENVFENNAAGFFNFRNQHYYANPENFIPFFQNSILPLEVKNNISSREGWLTETGYPISSDNEGNVLVSERKQADYLVKIFVQAFSQNFKRVFFLTFKELIEGDMRNWGIVREDLSPRPAFAALCMLTRYLNSAEYVSRIITSETKVFYFKKNNGEYIAVMWGKFGKRFVDNSMSIHDVFGRKIEVNANNYESPIFISGIKSLPKNLDIQTNSEATINRIAPPTFRIESAVLHNGRLLPLKYEHTNHLTVANNDEIVLTSIIHKFNIDNSSLNNSFKCEAGMGVLFLKSRASSANSYSCAFKVASENFNQSFIKLSATDQHDFKDTTYILLKPDPTRANIASSTTLWPKENCQAWQGRASNNSRITLKPIVNNTNKCSGLTVTTHILTNGDTWTFPSLALFKDELTNGKVVRVELLKNSSNTLFPVTPIMIQLVDPNGTWIVDLLPDNNLVSDTLVLKGSLLGAYPAPWRRSTEKNINLSTIQSLLIGWGAYEGQANQEVSYSIKSINIQN